MATSNNIYLFLLTSHVHCDIRLRVLCLVVVLCDADVRLAKVLLGQHRDLHRVLDDGGADGGVGVIDYVAVHRVPDQGRGRRAWKQTKKI